MPWVIALRVVSLPATASRMTKNANSTSSIAFAVDVGLDQLRHDVVGRTAAPLLGHGVGVAHQLGVGSDVVRLEVGVVGVHDASSSSGTASRGRPLARRAGPRSPAAAGASRCRRRSCRCPSRLAVGDDVAGRGGELLLQRRDRPRREKPRHELAQPGVFGRVVVDQQRLGQLQLIGLVPVWHAHHGALAVRRPQIAVAGDRLDVLVAGDHPVAAVIEYRLGLLVPPHRRRSCAARRTRSPECPFPGCRDR